MNVSDLLNPLPQSYQRARCISTPLPYNKEEDICIIGKPRSRFSEYEDNIIRQGVANRLTWGQISDLLPHRKRATCFNRYRTLQGIRKSRKSPASSYYNSPPSSPQEYDYYKKRLSSSSTDSSSSSPSSDYFPYSS